MPRAASTAPVRPKGSVRTECSHLIISSVVPMLRKLPRTIVTVGVVRRSQPLPCGSGCAPIGAPMQRTVTRFSDQRGLRAQHTTRVPNGRLM